MGSKAELACVYSALILAVDDVAIMGEKIQTILKAASVDVEPYWPGLFAKALEGINVKGFNYECWFGCWRRWTSSRRR